jgi:hypothetical protein
MTTANIYGVVDNGYGADTWSAYATAREQANWQFLGDGYAIEWPDLDEHIGVEGLWPAGLAVGGKRRCRSG